MTMRQAPNYGWVIIGITIIITALVYGIRHSFSVFFPSILDEFGWNRGSTAVMLSLNLITYGLLAPVAGSLGDRWNTRKIMPFGVIVLGLVTAGCGFASELWHFYLLYGIMTPLGMAFCGWPMVVSALPKWFGSRLGLVMGLGQAGIGLSFSFGLFTEFAISQLGWRHAYFVVAGLMAAVLLPLILFFFYPHPESKGQKTKVVPEKISTENLTTEPVAGNDTTRYGWTLRQAVRTHRLWCLVASNSLYFGIAAYMVLAHQVKFAIDAGYSHMFAASIFALYGICMVAGQLSSVISDRIGREKTVTLAVIISIGSLVALISVRDTSQTFLLYVFTICFGYGSGLFTPTIFAGAADLFHGKHFGGISSLVLTGMGVGGVIGPWLGGYIYDISGSYINAFILCMVSFGLSCIAFWIAAPRKAIKLK